jgi:hypothetical protein
VGAKAVILINHGDVTFNKVSGIQFALHMTNKKEEVNTSHTSLSSSVVIKHDESSFFPKQ